MNRPSPPNQRPGNILKQIFCILLWGLIIGHGVYLFSIHSFDMVLYRLFPEPDYQSWKMILSLAGGVLLMAVIFTIHYRWKSIPELDHPNLNKVFFPLLLALPFFILPLKMYSLIGLIAIAGAVMFRYCHAVTANRWLTLHENGSGKWGRRYLLPLLLTATLIFIVSGFLIQKKAFDVMYLCWSDWGYFYEALHNTMIGKWFWLNKLGINFLGSRFCPGLIVLLPYMKLFSSPYDFFFMSSVILGSGSIVVYLLCRRLTFSALESTIFALTYLLIPGFFNMNLCLGYSFHEIYFTIPTVLLAFYFYEGKKYLPALLFFLFSMTIQETVPVLWIGFGLVAIVQRRFRLALTLILISLSYYYFANRIAVPYFRGADFNASMFRYSHLGNTMGEIALSPFTRPGAFWGSLLRPGTFYYLTVLLLPVFILTLSFPLGLGAAGIILVFLCIEESSQTQNIMIHYQTMIQNVIVLNTLYCYRRLKDGEVSPWFNFLLWGTMDHPNVCRLRAAVLLALPATALTCFICFSQAHFSRVKQSNLWQMYDCRQIVTELNTLIPAGAELTATMRLAGHFSVRNDVYHDVRPITGKYPLKDYVVMDILDPFCPYELRDYLLKSPDYHLLYCRSVPGHHIMLWRRGVKTNLPRPLVEIDEKRWLSLGIPLHIEDRDFSMRVIFIKENGQRIARFMLRLEKTVDYDVTIYIRLYDGRVKQVFSNVFGNGYCPAFASRPGETYMMDAVLPGNFGTPQSVTCELKKIPNTAGAETAEGKELK